MLFFQRYNKKSATAFPKSFREQAAHMQWLLPLRSRAQNPLPPGTHTHRATKIAIPDRLTTRQTGRSDEKERVRNTEHGPPPPKKKPEPDG